MGSKMSKRSNRPNVAVVEDTDSRRNDGAIRMRFISVR